MEKGKCFFSIEDIKRANDEAGRYFFSPNTLRFFKSRVLSTVYKGQYFITSEKEKVSDQRKYTIRRIDLDTHSIGTVGDFMKFSSAEQAKRAIKELPDV